MSRFNVDAYVGPSLRIVACLGSAIVVGVLSFLLIESLPALHALGVRWLSDDHWHPAPDATRGSFGMLPLIVGTLGITTGAIALAAPAGIASAVFSCYYAPRGIAGPYRRLVEVLAGIPSVVFGLWGLVVLAPLISKWSPPGQSLLAGICVVALMILPTVMVLTEAAVLAVPQSLLQAGVALGMGRLTIIRDVVLPAARGGIATGVVLGATRAAGETMAVVMVCGNVVAVPESLFDPVRTLTANIALEMGYATGTHRSALFASGLLLLVMVIGLVMMSEWMGRRR